MKAAIVFACLANLQDSPYCCHTMTDFIEIEGAQPLRGIVRIGGAKNAALPLVIASLLTPDQCRFSNVPNLEDTSLLLSLLQHFGAMTEYDGSRISIETPRLIATDASYSLVKALRASFWVLAPLLARGGAARVALPGGDIIGARPVDLHLQGLTQLGAEIQVKHGVVFAAAPRGLTGTTIELRFPSVGATHQLLMAAALARGTTVIRGAAREPEVVALADMISSMGGDIEGAGSSQIVIHGKESLHGAEVALIGDRIEAGTYLLAAVATRGVVKVDGVDPQHLQAFIDALADMGAHVETEAGRSIAVSAQGTLHGTSVSTAPFPGFPTDLQAPFMAAATTVEGSTTIEENIFEGRFGHVSELCRMGASIAVVDRSVTITGRERLSAAPVEAHDIRAGAALVIAALAAEGTSAIFEPQHLRRGYEHLERKLRNLGARITHRIGDLDDIGFAGC